MAVISTYFSMVAAASWSSAAWLLVAANARLSKWTSSCSRMSYGSPTLDVGAVDEAREDTMVPLCQVCGANHIRLVGGHGRLALQRQLEGLEEALPL